jgi:hypothetical protein
MGALVVQLSLAMDGLDNPVPAALEWGIRVGLEALEQPESVAIAANNIVAQMMDACRDMR